MIRITSLKLVEPPGGHSRLEGKLVGDTRIEVRRDRDNPKRWLFLATHQLIPAPSVAGPTPGRRSAMKGSRAVGAAARDRDLFVALESVLNDPLEDVGEGR
jgi:hypothetical protein